MDNDSETFFYYRLGHIAAARQELECAVACYRDGEHDLGLHSLQQAVMHIGKAMGFDSAAEMVARLKG